TNPKTSLIQRSLEQMAVFLKKKEARLTDMLTSCFSEKSREGEETASRLLRFTALRWGSEERRKRDMLMSHASSASFNRDLFFFQKYNHSFEILLYEWCCRVCSVPPTAPALFSEIEISVHHPSTCITQLQVHERVPV
ncbi:MAG: hypothetical protein PV344_03355, partial [Anaplasma sp.]|nr:hypothetical protein [Anaplasma sp.]